MESSNRSENVSDNNHNGNVEDMATPSSSKEMGSPKTPIRQTYDSSCDSDDSEELESPQFPHLIPVYNRRNTSDYDLDDVRIGWDDGCGSIKSVIYGTDKNPKKLKRRRRGLYSERRYRSTFGPYTYDSSPSPRHSNANNETAIQEELNDYLGCILKCLSAKKRNRQLMKSKNENNLTTVNNNISNLLNDSTDDNFMIMCSQAVEKTISTETNCDMQNSSKSTVKGNTLSIAGISPLKEATTINNNNYNTIYQHTAKKFKPIECSYKNNENLQSHTVTKDDLNNEHSLFGNINNNSSLPMRNDFIFDDDDDLFSAIDLSEIDKQITSNVTNTISNTQDFIKQQQNKNNSNSAQLENRSTSSTSSTRLWRQCHSSQSVVSKQSLSRPQAIKTNNNISNFNGGTNKLMKPKLCTPAEIAEKRERARRTLFQKYNLKNNTIS